jgi:hypothetical protein
MNVNDKKCFVNVCFSKIAIAIAITTLRKHVRRGFVCGSSQCKVTSGCGGNNIE